MRRCLSAAALVVLFLAMESTSFAGRPHFFFQPRTRTYRPLHVGADYYRAAPSYDERYRYLNARYPKYTGAFHANYFQSIGVASGDIGFRGNGVYATPW